MSSMSNVVVIAVLLIIVGAAVSHIVKEKKKGTACIGCSHAGTCARKNEQDYSCGFHK